jgi:hypothetical protein
MNNFIVCHITIVVSVTLNFDLTLSLCLCSQVADCIHKALRWTYTGCSFYRADDNCTASLAGFGLVITVDVVQSFGEKTNAVLWVGVYMRNWCLCCLTWRAQSAMMILAFMLELLLGVPLWTVTNTARFYTRIKDINYVRCQKHLNKYNYVCVLHNYVLKRSNDACLHRLCFKSVPYK